MAIADLQRNLVQLGRIRLGQKKTSSSGRERPDRLDTYRFTSAAQYLIEEIAGLYGGDAQPWDGGHGKQWEVVTEAALIPIYLPQQVIDPFYEAWKGGVCSRRCNGLVDTIHQAPCDCNPEARTCKPTTHLSVMLADVPGIGIWRLTTHGIWAAAELSHLSTLIEGIRIPLPGRLLLENRERKHWDRKEQKVVTKSFNVPVVLIDAVTSRHVAIGGDAVSQVVQAQAAAQAVEATPTKQALEAAPAPRQTTPQPDPAMVQRALAAIAAASPEQMQDIHARIVKMGSPPQVVDAFKERLGQQEMQRRAAQTPADPALDPWAEPWAGDDTPGAASAAPPEPEQPSAPTEASQALPYVPAATGDGSTPDRQAAVTRLLGVAGTRGINRKQLDARLQSDYDVTLKTATAEQLDALAITLGAGA